MRRTVEEEIKRAIAIVLKKVREKHDITQEEAAEQVGITVEHYARIERGQAMPSLAVFGSIAIVMDVSADVLLGRSAEQFEPGNEPPKWFVPGKRRERKQLRRVLRLLDKAPPEVIAMTEGSLKHGMKLYERLQSPDDGDDSSKD